MTLLRALSEKAEDTQTRVVATFQLAQALKNQVDISSQLKTIPAEREAFVAEQIGAEYISNQEVSAEELARQVGNIDLIYEAVGE